MKISVIGAGNVGSLAAMRIAQEGLGEVTLIDIAKGLARGKALDLEDACPILKSDYRIKGSDDISQIKDSDIVIVTAGLTRKPGMSREELINKNALVLKDICLNIKNLAPLSIILVVTNPLDLMTYLALKVSGFKKEKVFGMGVTLDAARFANLIAQELDMPSSGIKACVIGSHGEGMLPLPGNTFVKGVALGEFLDEEKIDSLIKRTVNRGQEIVTLLGSGSAYFAPSAAIAAIIGVIVKNELKVLGASAYLNGEYGIKDICIGVPVRLGRNGIEKIIELELSQEEKAKLTKSADALRLLAKDLPY